MVDEVAFGQRKYHRGRFERKGGVQWGITQVKVNPITGKAKGIDIQLVANTRMEMVAPMVARKSAEGAILTTNCAKIYPGVLKQIKASRHLTVNHTENFQDPDTGATTNAIEGMHVEKKNV